MTWPASHQFAGAVLFFSGQLLWTQRRLDLPRWHWLLAVSTTIAVGLFAWWPAPEWSFNVSQGVLFVSLLWGLMGSWALRHNTRSRGLLLCGCGLLAWTAGASQIWELWFAIVALGYLRIADRCERNSASPGNTGIAADVLGLGLASLGFLLLQQSPDAEWLGIPFPTLSLVLILSGAGWLMRTFPYPQLPIGDAESPWDDVGNHLLPVLLAPVLWMNLLPHLLISERQLAILMPAAILPLLLTGLRADHRSRSETTLRLIPYVASLAGMAAVILSGWDLLQPDLSLQEAHPLLTGSELLPFILLADSVAWMMLAAGDSRSSGTSGWFRNGCLILGALSLAGLPPFPGYWWRLQLLSALVIPHSRAPLLGLYEVTPGNVIFSGLLATGLLLVMRPILRMLPREI